MTATAATAITPATAFPLGELLDDYSPQGMDQQRGFYQAIQMRMNAVDPASLDKEQKADLEAS